MFALALALVLGGCRVTSADLPATPTIPPVSFEAPPPAAVGPGQDRLFQQLYAGEAGDSAFLLGQRVRVRAWLSVAAFSPEELQGLRWMVMDVRKLVAKAEADEAAADKAELEALRPVYEALDARLAAGEVSDADLATFAGQLSAARVAAEAGGASFAARAVRVEALLDAVASWQSQLPVERQAALAEARFFLVRHASPFGNVGAYHTLVGLDWDGGEFGQLDPQSAAPDQPQLDVGGLWRQEKYRTGPGKYLTPRQLQAILVMAALEPALSEALGLPADVLSRPTPPRPDPPSSLGRTGR